MATIADITIVGISFIKSYIITVKKKILSNAHIIVIVLLYLTMKLHMKQLMILLMQTLCCISECC